MVSVANCIRSFLVMMTCLVLLCFVSTGIEARILRNDDNNGIIAVDSATTTTALKIPRMTGSIGTGGSRKMITTDHKNEKPMNISKESNHQLDHEEYLAATETGGDELVIMDYSPARKKPPIHN